MKKLIVPISILFFFNFSSLASVKKITDTVYVICYQENLSNKFFNTNQDKNQLRVNYFFDVKWKLYDYEQNSIFFYYEGPLKQVLNEWTTSFISLKNIRLYKNIYTLEQFTKELSNNNFLTLIVNRKIQIIMLYGEKCSTKFEMFSVKVGTDLSSEG